MNSNHNVKTPTEEMLAAVDNYSLKLLHRIRDIRNALHTHGMLSVDQVTYVEKLYAISGPDETVRRKSDTTDSKEYWRAVDEATASLGVDKENARIGESWTDSKRDLSTSILDELK